MSGVPTIIDSSSGGLARADFRAWREQGGRLLIHRAAYGTGEDKGLRRAWERAGAAGGLLRGVYLVLCRRQSAARQVEAWARILEALGGHGDVVPWLDLEGDDLQPAGRAAALEAIMTAWRGLSAAIGCAPGIYTSTRWLHDILALPLPAELAASPLWLADYVPPFPVAPPWGTGPATVAWRCRMWPAAGWTMWQRAGNVRPTEGPLHGCCIDESVWAPGVRAPWEPAVAAPLPADPVCTRA